MRQFICRSLAISGLRFSECLEAGNGLDALQILRTNRVDVVVCDINMPEMDGEQFVEHLIGDPELSATPILVVSADATAPRVQRVLALGARGYLLKPFLPETLRAELQQIISPAATRES